MEQSAPDPQLDLDYDTAKLSKASFCYCHWTLAKGSELNLVPALQQHHSCLQMSTGPHGHTFMIMLFFFYQYNVEHACRA